MNYTDKLPSVEKLTGGKAIFLLGTDKYIGEEGEKETRVGIVPDQIEAIKHWLKEKGVALDFYFVEGAGARAGFPDSTYSNIGGKVLSEEKLSSMPAPHVVHALKEPSAYETSLPASFLRIGALHSGAISQESGVAQLLKRQNFCAIFDGSHTQDENGKAPIRQPMSVYAGDIAAEFSVDHFIGQDLTDTKIVISGGGVAGRTSLNRFLELDRDRCAEIIIVEKTEEGCASLQIDYNHDAKVKVVQGPALTPEQVRGANAVILTAFERGELAPTVLLLTDIAEMSDNSIIVDISIDEKGGIEVPDFDRRLMDVELPDIVSANKKAIDSLGKNIVYNADDHLPRHKPKEASIAHGEGVTPYVSLLLYFSAKLGGAEQVAKYVFDSDFTEQEGQAKQLFEHLRRGMAYYKSSTENGDSTISYNKNVIKEEDKRRSLEEFFKNNGIDFDSFE